MSTYTGGTLQAVFICALFMVVGPSLIMLNQHILKALNFPYPMILSGMGVLASGLFARLMVTSGVVQIHRQEAIEGWLWYKRVLPVGMASAGTLAFGNMVYLFLDVGFIQMLKSFTPTIIMLTGYLFKIETTTTPTVVSVLIISIGTAATCSFTPELNIIGIAIMFLSELTEAIRLVITQFMLQQLKFGVTEGLYVLAPACAFWLFLAATVFELPAFIENNGMLIILTHPLHFLLAATMGVGVNFISYFVIQYTSSLTMKILGTVRNVCMVILGVVVYKELITHSQFVGYSITLTGFAGYNLSKMGYFDPGSHLMAEFRRWLPCLCAIHGKAAAKVEGDEEKGLLLQ